MKKLLFPLLLISLHSFANFDIRQVPASISVEDAEGKRAAKKEIFLNMWKIQNLDKFPFYKSENKGLTSLTAAVARIITKTDIESVNNYLLDERFKPGLPGTRISIAGVCKRKGDYDFALQELVRIAYLGKGIISDKAYARVIGELLNQRGNKHFTHFRICMKKKKDTENHILMTESARYLTNQILFQKSKDKKYDNEENGFNEWMRKHLKHLIVAGFDEINSKPYAGYTISTLLNIYDFAENAVLKNYAKTLLDYLNMKYAVESIGNKRYPTFRRQVKHYNNPELDHKDAQTGMMMYWVGNYYYLMDKDIDLSKNAIPYGARFAFNAAISTYEPERVVMEYFFSDKKGLQIYDHNFHGRQINYKHPLYTISGGGVHRSIWPKVSLVNDVLAAPTVLIPKVKGSSLNELFHFLGDNNPKKRSNLCVGDRVMCGVNLKVPTINEKCVERFGNWSFYNFRKEECFDEVYNGLVIALYSKKVKDKRFDNVGLVEVASTNTSYNNFKKEILERNSEFNYKAKNTFISSLGEKVEFQFFTKSKGCFPILNHYTDTLGRVRGYFHKLNENGMQIFSASGQVINYEFE